MGFLGRPMVGVAGFVLFCLKKEGEEVGLSCELSAVFVWCCKSYGPSASRPSCQAYL